jgi:hypothetical protein
MAWRIHENVVRGEIDNRTPAQVIGKIWLAGRDQPLVLRLSGNCHKDLAGRLLTFSNAKPRPDVSLQLTNDQTGVAGDITAARKVRVIEGFDACDWRAEKPSHLANALYVEWYSETNGRVVIESADYEITVSEPSWEISDEEEAQQREASSNALQAFLNRVAGVPDPREEAAYANGPENEYEWELFLRASDRRVDKLSEVMEKYHDHPDCDRLVARAMGWTHIEEMLDAQAELEKQGESEAAFSAEEIESEEYDEIDWTPLPRHPLVERVCNRSVELHQLIGKKRDKDLQDLASSLAILGGKLAGALGVETTGACAGLGMEGLVVAKLKRALNELSRALDAASQLKQRNVELPFSIDEWNAELLQIRQEILALMDDYRQQGRQNPLD